MTRGVRLLYITYHENVLGSGILYTQVIEMLERLRSLEEDASIVLLSFMSPQLLWRERAGFKALGSKLENAGIRFIALPMLVPTPSPIGLQFFICLWLLPVLLTALYYNSRVIHSRSYIAGMLGLAASTLLGVPLVFDPRGPFPEEMIMNGVWRRSSVTFRIWKKLEGLLIRRAGATIGVTPEFRDEFRRRGAQRSVFVPNRTDTTRFHNAVREFRESGPGRPGVRCELLFIGEMFAVWNDPYLVAKHFIALLKHHPNARLRLITRAGIERALDYLAARGVDPSRVLHQSGAPQEMPRLMQGATFGLIFRAVDIHSMWSVKFAEYLAAGIPIIVDRSMVGLPVEIIRRRRLGFIADPDRPDDYRIVDDILASWREWSDRCIEYARRRLDVRSTSRQFLRLYRILTSAPQ